MDEGAGGEALVSDYRRLVQDEKVDVDFASISSGLAATSWCRSPKTLQDDELHVGLRRRLHPGEPASTATTSAPRRNATPEMLAVLLYLLKTKPNFKTIAVVNQDYAWGRESWEISPPL